MEIEKRLSDKFKDYNYGGDGRSRTADPLLAKQMLYQLSYTPKYSEYNDLS
jgi:hypothetical protein